MKVIKYQVLGKTAAAVLKEDGTYENVNQDLLFDVIRPYSEQAKELAENEAYNGEYTIEDDGLEETAERTQEERIKDLEEAFEMLLSGVTE